MRKKLIGVIVFLTIVYSSVLVAQPGYQGKKNLVKYSTFISPALLNSTYNSARIVNFNLTHNIAFNRVLTRRSAVGLKLSYCKTSIPYELYLPNYNGASNNYYD